MRRPRPRLRTLLIAVAVAGLVCGFEVMRRRRDEALSRVEFWSGVESRFGPAVAADPDGFGKFSQHGQTMREIADEARAMRIKWERATRYPWLPVEPDPIHPI